MRIGEEEEEELVLMEEGEAERTWPFGGECVVLLAPESRPPSRPRAEGAWMVELVECRRGRRGAGRDEVRGSSLCCLLARCEERARFVVEAEGGERRVVGGSGSLKRTL